MGNTTIWHRKNKINQHFLSKYQNETAQKVLMILGQFKHFLLGRQLRWHWGTGDLMLLISVKYGFILWTKLAETHHLYPHLTFTHIFQATKDSVGGSPTDVNSYVTAQSFWEASLVHLPQWPRSPASETAAGARKTPKIANVPKQLQNTGGLEPKHVVLTHPKSRELRILQHGLGLQHRWVWLRDQLWVHTIITALNSQESFAKRGIQLKPLWVGTR